MEIVKDKHYEIIPTYNNRNAIRVIQKAIMAKREDAGEDALQFQKDYENRQIFFYKN